MTFDDLMQGFGVVTVMNACIYKLKEGKSYVGRGSCVHKAKNGGALKPSDFVCTGLYLDTLKIANLNQEGPTKTITGGQYANPLLKYGKTMTLEMQDALGRAPVLTEFFGCDREDGVLSVTDKFPGAFAIEGDTFFINQKTGEKVLVHILIPQFLPDAILSLTQDAEGDAAVFDLNGTVSMTKIRIDDRSNHDTVNDNNTNTKDVFYQIREKSWFHPTNSSSEVGKAFSSVDTRDSDYHDAKLTTPIVNWDILYDGDYNIQSSFEISNGETIEKEDSNVKFIIEGAEGSDLNWKTIYSMTLAQIKEELSDEQELLEMYALRCKVQGDKYYSSYSEPAINTILNEETPVITYFEEQAPDGTGTNAISLANSSDYMPSGTMKIYGALDENLEWELLGETQPSDLMVVDFSYYAYRCRYYLHSYPRSQYSNIAYHN